MKKLIIMLSVLFLLFPIPAKAACCDLTLSYVVNTSNQFVLKVTASGASSVNFYWDGALLSHDTVAPFEATVAMTNGHTFSADATWTPGGTFSKTHWGEPRIPEIKSGTQTTCAQYLGKLYCWGNGDYDAHAGAGAVGVDVAVPTLVPFLDSNVRSLAMANEGGCIIVGASTVLGYGGLTCWGRNDYGILGLDPVVTPYSSPRLISNDVGYSQVATGIDFACAMTNTGALRCLGAGYDGQMGNSTHVATNTSLITTYSSGVTTVAAGGGTACVIKTTGHVECWGRDNRGQAGNGGSAVSYVDYPHDVGLVNIVDIAVGYRHACALDSSNLVYCWGDNSYGELGFGFQDTSVHVSPVFASSLTGAVSLSAGQSYGMCIITTTGSMKCVGENDYGQIGSGSVSAYQATPTQVSGFSSGVLSAGVGAYNGCGFRNGHGYCWGDNGSLQVGNTSASNPQLIPLIPTGF